MILTIDNYDSFTYNLVQYIGEIGYETRVVRNDHITEKELESLPNVEKLIISPGPCTPSEAGVSKDAVRIFASRGVPILGVCLGHQSIGEAFGGKIIHAPYLMHGKVSKIFHDGTDIFRDIPSPFTATRYHSLVIEKESLPEFFEVTARTEDDIIMGIRHKEFPVFGVQFHPESILTEHGHRLLENFLSM